MTNLLLEFIKHTEKNKIFQKFRAILTINNIKKCNILTVNEWIAIIINVQKYGIFALFIIHTYSDI